MIFNHLDGPTLIVTKLPDGSLAWTVMRPQSVSVEGGQFMETRMTLEGWPMAGGWNPGTPPSDWDREPGMIEPPATALPSAEVRRLNP